MEANELTIKDLMIGDWVVINNIPRQVTFIDDCINYKIIAVGKHPDGGRISYVGKLSEEVKPIPLTLEILEKNGFVANKHVYPYPYYEYEVKEIKVKVEFAFPQGNRTSYKKPWVCIDTEYVYIEHLPCMFVHQLQHALRLCGIEKEIIL